jgi:crotonobetainyl-CoA:carnitine CoA-transferase CaiB-like acyl-CoA transferase
MLGFPFRIGGASPAVRRPAPALGEHTAEVLAEVLGLGAGAVEALAAAGVVACAPPG